MTTPFLTNVVWDGVGSISVQNRLDESGRVATYIMFKPSTVSNLQIRKANLDDNNPELVFKLNNVESVVGLTASLISAYGSKTVTGSF